MILTPQTTIVITPMDQKTMEPYDKPVITTWGEFMKENKDGIGWAEMWWIRHDLENKDYAQVGGGAEALVRIEVKE